MTDLRDLTEDVRAYMLEEYQQDLEDNRLYVSERLNSVGVDTYKGLLIEALTLGNVESLTTALQAGYYFNEFDMSRGKPMKMPSNAAQLLAGSEFNRFYIRGVCRKAIADGSTGVEVYRARVSSWPRPGSEVKIGTSINPNDLLDDLRRTVGAAPNLLPEINSGLSVKL